MQVMRVYFTNVRSNNGYGNSNNNNNIFIQHCLEFR